MYPLIPSLNPVAHAKQLSLTGKTLLISDLHLKSGQSFKHSEDLKKFIESRNVSNLIVNGDWFNSPKDAQEFLGNPPSGSRALKVLGLDGLPLNVFWVLGSPAHDPDLPEERLEPGRLEVLGRCVLITNERLELLVYHGHDLSLKGAFGHAWDRFVSKLSLERLWKRIAKVNKNVWVVFGHTHIPGVDPRSRVANCGGWQRVPFVHPNNTGILLSEDVDCPQLVQIA